MAVEVETPEQYMGDVMGNLSGRRGKIEGMDDRAGSKVIRAKVPLGEMFGYATDLRSQTQGRASYTMQFDSYSRSQVRRGRGHGQERYRLKVPRSYL